MEMIQELGEETSEALIGLCTAAGEITTGQPDELIQCLSKAKMCESACTLDAGKSWDHTECQNAPVAKLGDMQVTCQHLAMAANGDEIMLKYGIDKESHAFKVKTELDEVMGMLQQAAAPPAQ